MDKGWYCGLANRFTNHYYVKLKEDGIQSRCGQISLKMLDGKGVEILRPIKTKKNLCGSCKHLLRQDAEQTRMLEPFRY